MCHQAVAETYTVTQVDGTQDESDLLTETLTKVLSNEGDDSSSGVVVQAPAPSAITTAATSFTTS